MVTFIVVYHSSVVITNEIDSYEFIGMKKTFLLNEFLTHENLVGLVHERLGCHVRFEGWIDIGSSNDPRMKMMSLVYNEKDWTTYVGVVMKLEICGIELVARMVIWNDIGDESSQSPTLPETVDEQHVECDIVITQPSQETQNDIDVDEPPFIASNETVLNMELVSRSVGVDDTVANAEFISDVDSQLEFIPEYEATFRHEHAEDSTDDRLVPELSNRDKVLLQRALVEHASEMSDC
jgi:hypothetical protein